GETILPGPGGASGDRSGGTRDAPPGSEPPRPLDPFVGRRRELDRLRTLLRTSRLVTVTGPGGVGKTRLALEYAAARRGPTRLAELAPPTGPVGADGLSRAVAAALGGAATVPGGPGGVGPLARALDGHRLLLVLDNCEHLADACARLAAELLGRCPRLRILATSREGLRVPGEVVFRLDELPLLPAGPGRPSDAVRLFMERAAATVPGAVPGAGAAVYPRGSGDGSRDGSPHGGARRDLAVIAEICRRLDGLPLAIELAARRAAVLPPGEILAGLDEGLTLLSDGSRSGPGRHRDLSAAIDWSHRLLTPREREVLRKLSVLPGGFDADAVAAVCAADSRAEVLRTLCALEAKSLVVRVPGPGGHERARFRQLGTVRAYGLARLTASGELHDTWRRAVERLTRLVTAEDPAGTVNPAGTAGTAGTADAPCAADPADTTRIGTTGSTEGTGSGPARPGERGTVPAAPGPRRRTFPDHTPAPWDHERKNLAAAVAYTVTRNGTPSPRLALELARTRFRQEEPAAAYALLADAGLLAPHASHRSHGGHEGDDSAATALAARALHRAGDPATAFRLAARAVAAARAGGDPALLANALDARAEVRSHAGAPAEAVTDLTECLALVAALGRPVDTARCEQRLAWALLHTGAAAEAEAWIVRCLPVLRPQPFRHGRSAALRTAGAIRLELNDPEGARELFAESLRHAGEPDREALYALEGLAATAVEQGAAHRALRLFAAASAVRGRLGAEADAPWRRRTAGAAARAEAALLPAARERARAAGRGPRWPRLCAYALADGSAPGPSGGSASLSAAVPFGVDSRSSADLPGALEGGLTGRETEVALLLAEGLTNREIAVRLRLSPSTVATHLNHIRDKLNIRSRTRIALWVTKNHSATLAPLSSRW
ncbi:LuxR C-terminal-related transcriptional regulator, partial [Streptomyces clavuligerus]